MKKAVDVRMRCCLCGEFVPKNICNHYCRAGTGTCDFCPAVSIRHYSKRCWKHDTCLIKECGALLYKRRGFCKAHLCRYRDCKASFECLPHRKWVIDNANKYGWCSRCGKAAWRMYVPYWLVKARKLSKDVARYMTQFIDTTCDNCVEKRRLLML